MSEKKLNNLAEEYPEYSKIFEEIIDWFSQHPNQKAISMDYFYSDKYPFSISDINISFMLLQKNSVLKSIYRVIDNDGSKIGTDFNKIEEIPEELDNMKGEKKRKSEVAIVPFFALEKQF